MLRYWRVAFLADLRETGSLTDSAVALGIDRSTVWRARKTSKSFDREVLGALEGHYEDKRADKC